MAAASDEIVSLARRYQAGMWVVDAQLIQHDLEYDYRSGYHSYRTLPTTSRRQARLARLRTSLGLVTTERFIRRAGTPDVDRVAARLTAGALTGHPYDRDTHSLRVPDRMVGRDPNGPSPRPTVPYWRLLLPVYGIVPVVMGSGIAMVVLHGDGAWALAPVAVAVGLVWPTGRAMTRLWGRPRLATQLASGAGLIGFLFLTGAMYARNAPGTPRQAALVALLAALGIGLLAFIIRGLTWALVHSWFGRHANWALPAFASALALALPWFGGLLHTMYLRRAFGLPSEAASVSVYWQYAASAAPVAAALLMAALVLAFAGWMRHFHQWVNSRGLVITGIPFTTLVVVSISLLAGVVQFENAAGRAWADARSGRTPASYFGVQGRFVCVEPVEDRIAVFNGPLDTEWPLLTFGTSGDRVWLWDSRRAQALSVRLEDVIVTQAGQETHEPGRGLGAVAGAGGDAGAAAGRAPCG
ncbi:hypothetical protein [Streptomyces sp. NBC_01429]|uniref:hypothetical protein n=1 Tax=Streptomyces sp. NBC_01429 TaxID=2903862 RepID=UPI002E2B7540|nr:hypothetical protein [Streptomyces sp. NBC_01429]